MSDFYSFLADFGPLFVTAKRASLRGFSHARFQSPLVLIKRNAAKIYLFIGRSCGPQVEILSGLKEGEWIVTSVTDFVQQGVNVRTRIDERAAEQQRGGATVGSRAGL